MTTTILIADDHTLVRETWSYILDNHPQFRVIAEAGNAEEAIAKARELRPHLVIMDINLPGMDGIEATAQIRQQAPDTKILGVSLHRQPSYARRMIQKGAAGYITKNSPREEMFNAIKEVMKGKRYVCNEIKTILSEQLIEEENTNPGLSALSSREISIVDRLKKGDSSKEIAAALYISVKTVEVHRYNILKKLKLKNTAALINFVHHCELKAS